MNNTASDLLKGLFYGSIAIVPVVAFLPVRTAITIYSPEHATILYLLAPLPFLIAATIYHHFNPRHLLSLLLIVSTLFGLVMATSYALDAEWQRLKPLAQSVSGFGYFRVTEAVDRNILYGLLPGLLVFFGCMRIVIDDFRGATADQRRRSFRPAGTGTHGSARMGNVRDAAKRFDRGSLIIGEAYDPARHPDKGGKAPALWWDANGHAMTVSGPGGGKTGSVVIPNLLLTTFAAVVNDPKGEVYAVTREARLDKGHEVFHLKSGADSPQGFNVLDWLEPSSEEIGEHVDAIVQLMSVVGQTDTSGNAIFRENGENIVAIMILEVMFDDSIPKEKKTLLKVRERLTAGDILDELTEIAAMDRDHCFGITPDRASAIINYAERSQKTFGNFYIYAEQITRFLTLPTLARLVCGNSFSSAEILTGKIDVFVTIPPMTQQANPAVARLIIGTLATQIWRAEGNVANRILFMLDEMGTLGHMPVLEKIRDNMRGYGVTIWGIVQNLEQLRSHADALTGWAAGVTIWQMFGITGLETAEHASRLTGMTTVLSRSESEGSGGSHTMAKLGSRTVNKSKGENFNEVGRPVMTPDEIRTMAADASGNPDEQLLLIRNYPALRCGMAKYWRRPQLDKIAAANPFYERAKKWKEQEKATQKARKV